MLRIVILIALLLTGCAAVLGERYEPLPAVPDGMGVIYIYEDGAGIGSRVYIAPDASTPSAKHYLLLATDGYYPYLTAAGRVRLFSDDESNPFGCVEFDVEPGSSHWVSVSEKGDAMVVRLEPAETAHRKLGEHRRLTRSALAKASGVSSPEPCTDPFAETPEVIELQPKPEPKPKPEPDPDGPDETDEETDEENDEESEEETSDDDSPEIELL